MVILSPFTHPQRPCPAVVYGVRQLQWISAEAIVVVGNDNRQCTCMAADSLAQVVYGIQAVFMSVS